MKQYFTQTQRKWITCLATVALGFVAMLNGKMSGAEFVQLASTIVGGFYLLNVAEKTVKINVGKG